MADAAKLDPVSAHLADCIGEANSQIAADYAQKMAQRNVETISPMLRGNGTEQRVGLLILWFAGQHLLGVVSECLRSTGEMRDIERKASDG